MSGTLQASRLTGTGSAFPKRIMTNQELVELLAKHGQETSHDWIVERTGIHERRIADPADESERNSGLGLRAARHALEMAGRSAEDIDLIVYATCTPDTPIPSTACWLQKKLGAKNAAAYDINAACSGFLYALTIADNAIRTGSQKCILVVGAEVLSSVVNWQDRGTCLLFGDGAGAVIVEPAEATSPSRIYSHSILSDGHLWDLFHIPAGGSNCAVTPEIHAQGLDKMHMKGREIFKYAVRTMAEYAEKELQKNGFTLNDLNWVVAHQANLRILEGVADRLGLPMSKMIVNLDRYGNTSAATVPSAFDEAVRSGKIRRGDLVLFDVFGAGVTQGAALLRW